MQQLLEAVFQEIGSLSMTEILLRVSVCVGLGIVICFSYAIAHAGAVYSKKFNVTLLALTVLTGTVMMVIGNNLALSLGMVGALSIVRFRTAIKDSRDTAYIFWTIIVGICCGAGDFTIAGIGTAAVFIILLVFGAIKNDDRMLLIVRSTREASSKVEAVVYSSLHKKAKLRVKNMTEDHVEVIYEVSSSSLKRAEDKEMTITDKIFELEGIQYLNLVTQNDDIGS